MRFNLLSVKSRSFAVLTMLFWIAVNTLSGQVFVPEDVPNHCEGESFRDTIYIEDFYTGVNKDCYLENGGYDSDPTAWLEIRERIGQDTCVVGVKDGQSPTPGPFSYKVTFEHVLSGDNEFKIYLDTIFENTEIHTQPTNQNPCEGGSATFTVDPGSTAYPEFRWQVDNGSGGGYSDVSGGTEASLALSSVTSSMDDYKYMVEVSGFCGPNVESNEVTLTVKENTEIATQPEDDDACVGGNASFTVDAGNTDNPQYQWMIDDGSGSGFSDITDETGATLNLSSVTTGMDGYKYQVKVTGTCGPMQTSTAATLEILGNPEITAHPQSQEVCEGDPVSFSVDAGSTPDPGFQWQVNPGSGFTDITDETDDTYEINNAATSLNGNQYRVIVSGTCGTPQTSVEADLTVNEKSDFDVMLILDVSGSMGDPCLGCEISKLNELKKAIRTFMDTLIFNSYYTMDDRFGVVFFDSHIDRNNASLISMDPDEDDLNEFYDIINGMEDGTATAMGGGVQVGIDTLLAPHYAGNTKNLIMVTDGMQNMNPMVVYEPDDIKIKDQPVSMIQPPYGDSDLDPHTDPMRLNSDLGVKIYTIGINAYGSYGDLLMKMADSTGGVHNLDPLDNALKFDEFFTNSFVDMLRGCSPQLIDYRYGQMSGESQTEVFTVDRGVNHILLKLTGRTSDGPNLRFSVTKDNVPLTDIGQVSDGDHYRIFSINLPVEVEGQVIDAEGDWEMGINAPQGMNYQACAIVDNKSFEYETRIDVRNQFVGNAVEFSVFLQDSRSRPIEDARVTATVYKPARKFRKILCNASVAKNIRWRLSVLKRDLEYIRNLSQSEPDKPDLTNFAAIKRSLLLQNARFYKRFKPEEVTVDLTYKGGGLYSAQFNDTRVPGIYNIDFEIQGSAEGLGRFHRKESRSLILKFGKLHLLGSKLRVLYAKREPDIPARIYIRPKDEFGNLLGPGYPGSFQVITNARAGFPVDHLDGSYTIPLYGIDRSTDEEIEIRLMNETIFKGSTAELKSRLPFFIRRHLKSIVPVTDNPDLITE